jgi:gluconate 2-dehydrogenase alpha chain
MSNPLPKVDVLVIGLGAAGSIASYALTNAGISVVALEAGPRLELADFLAHLDELAGNWMGDPKNNDDVPTWRPNESTAAGAASGAAPMINAVGGTAIHYSTQFWRFQQSDFKIRSETIEKYGKGALPPGSTVADWPVSYTDLEPYYDQIEYLIGVGGKTGNNPFEEPRSREYPLPPSRTFGFGKHIAEAMSANGFHPLTQPTAIATEAYNDRPACTYCGFCTGYGCWNNSKSNSMTAVIPAAEATGKLEIRTNSRVVAILTNDKGEATGVQYRDENGELQEQPAGFIILSSYVWENTRLLLLSKSKAFPDGVSNKARQVGKNYMTHAYSIVNGSFPGRKLNLFNGTRGQSVNMTDLLADNFDHTGLGFIRGGLITASNEVHPISTAGGVPPGTPTWGPDYKRWVAENGQSVTSLFGQQEVLSYEQNYIDLDDKKTDKLGLPTARLTYSYRDNEELAMNYLMANMKKILTTAGADLTWGFNYFSPVNTHSYGGTRMGDDPSSSVVDLHSISHEVPNLAIMGGSTFASSSSYNPTETIQALAWFGAEYIADHLDELAI